MFPMSKLISDDRLLVDEYFSCTRVMYKRNVKAFTQLYCSRLRAHKQSACWPTLHLNQVTHLNDGLNIHQATLLPNCK